MQISACFGFSTEDPMIQISAFRFPARSGSTVGGQQIAANSSSTGGLPLGLGEHSDDGKRATSAIEVAIHGRQGRGLGEGGSGEAGRGSPDDGKRASSAIEVERQASATQGRGLGGGSLPEGKSRSCG